jgi:mannose-6-phosphate isomerase-like protein (cupin superfamily)
MIGTSIVEKMWGREEWLTNEPEYCAKWLIIEPMKRCSMHYHPIKKETFVVIRGKVLLEQRDVRGLPIEESLYPGDSRTIMPKTPHRFSSVLGAKILEISTHHEDLDCIRLEPSGDMRQ